TEPGARESRRRPRVTPTSAGATGQPAAPKRQDLPTSRSLLVRLRARDETAWRDCLAPYMPLGARWCLRNGLARAGLADVAQEVFRKVAGHIQGFRKESPGDSFRGWLCRITHRAIADFLRRAGSTAPPQGGTEALLRMQQHADPHSEELADEQDA